jgi:hypothetical protein
LDKISGPDGGHQKSVQAEKGSSIRSVVSSGIIRSHLRPHRIGKKEDYWIKSVGVVRNQWRKEVLQVVSTAPWEAGRQAGGKKESKQLFSYLMLVLPRLG